MVSRRVRNDLENGVPSEAWRAKLDARLPEAIVTTGTTEREMVEILYWFRELVKRYFAYDPILFFDEEPAFVPAEAFITD